MSNERSTPARFVTVTVRVASNDPVLPESRPKLSPVLSTNDVAIAACAVSMRPAARSTGEPDVARVVVTNALLMSAGVHSGWSFLNRAAAPATCGAAIEVPLNVTSPPPTADEVIANPGASTSGLNSSVDGDGPELNVVTTSLNPWAPTVMAVRAVPGLPIDARAPALPAAATTV